MALRDVLKINTRKNIILSVISVKGRHCIFTDVASWRWLCRGSCSAVY